MDFKALLVNMKEFQNQKLHSKTLSLENLKFPFIVLICGSSFAISLLILEIIFHCMRSKGRQQSKRYITFKTPQIGLSLIG